MKYEVSIRYHINGATSEIDTVDAPAGYTAEQYLADCRENADEEWNALLDQGDVFLTEIDEDDEDDSWREEYPEYADKVDSIIRNGWFNGALELMDDEIREDICNDTWPPASDAEFLARYMARHQEKYGEEFIKVW